MRSIGRRVASVTSPDWSGAGSGRGTRGALSFCAFAVRLRADRQALRETIGDDLLVEPAWDMLLDLFITRGEGKRTSVSALCLASCAPSSTALRWIATLEKRGLIVRGADPCDRRRYFVQLSATALLMLEAGLSNAAANWGITLHDESGMIGSAIDNSAGWRKNQLGFAPA